MPFEVTRHKKEQPILIRTASNYELTEYEKNKLAGIEENAQKNKLEGVRLNGNRLDIDTNSKEVAINLGDLAFKSLVTPGDLAADDIFFIKCELRNEDLGVNAK